MKKSALGAMLMIMVLSPVGASAQVNRPDPSIILCSGIVLSSPDEPGATLSFSATRSTDLVLRVMLPLTLQGKHMLELRLFAPGGHLYQSLTVPVAEPGKPPESRKVEDYPRPIREKAPVSATYRQRDVFAVDTQFPLGGSAIVANGLYGAWRIETYVDGARNPCTAPVMFSLHE